MSPVYFLISLLFLSTNLFPSAPAEPDYINWTEEQIVDFWSGRISKLGPQGAYEELMSQEGTFDDNQAHARDHMFGRALYKENNFSDIFVCTQAAHRLRYGCLHEYIGQTLSAYGLGFIPELLAVCEQSESNSFFSCRHGIGHGLLAANGYRFSDLELALDSCYDLTGEYVNDGVRGCAGGAFMEYSLRTMLDDAGEVRNERDIMSPCTGLSEEHQFGCLYWQPLWWRNGPLVNMGTGTDPYRLMGQYCREYVTTDAQAQACFSGIGNFGSGGAWYDYELAGKYCDAAAQTQAEEFYCRIRAYLNISNGQNDPTSEPEKVCTGLSGDSLQVCKHYVETGELPVLFDDKRKIELERIVFQPINAFVTDFLPSD